MSKKFAFTIGIFLLFIVHLHGQTIKVDSLGLDIVQDARIKTLVEEEIEINKKKEGKISGYRVQIHFGSERDKAKDVKALFLSKHANVAATEKYEQPNFKIRVGNFRTKLEAYKFMKEIAYDFPTAFIVQDEIELN